MANHLVTVTFDKSKGEIICNPDPLRVNKQDEVQWRSDQGAHTGDFGDKSPIDTRKWAGPQGVPSPAAKISGPSGTYKYTVTLQTGGKEHKKDPILIVN